LSLPDLSGPVTQAEFARLVGRSEGRVSQLVTDGTLPAGGTGLVWLRAFVDRLSAEAAGRHTGGPLDLGQERAALARSQREAVDMRNAVSRGEFAPIALLAEVLATASQAVAERLDHLPGTLKKACPQLTNVDRDHVLSVIASARNEWVRATAALVSQRIALTDDDAEADAAEIEPDAAP
jgi:phage terminase Nu1 subunit (DNA packaging protein)